MTEAVEVAHSILRANHCTPQNLDEARTIVKRMMPDETATVLDNVAWALLRRVKEKQAWSEVVQASINLDEWSA